MRRHMEKLDEGRTSVTRGHRHPADLGRPVHPPSITRLNQPRVLTPVLGRFAPIRDMGSGRGEGVEGGHESVRVVLPRHRRGRAYLAPGARMVTRRNKGGGVQLFSAAGPTTAFAHVVNPPSRPKMEIVRPFRDSPPPTLGLGLRAYSPHTRPRVQPRRRNGMDGKTGGGVGRHGRPIHSSHVTSLVVSNHPSRG